MTIHEGQVGAARIAAPRAPIGGVLAGAVLVAAGLLLLPEALGAIDDGDSLIGGPRLAPIVVSGGWLAIASTYLVQQIIAWRAARGPAGDVVPDAEMAGGHRWLTPALLIAALVAYVLLLDGLGFVLATGAFFVAAARILRSTRPRRDVAVAVPLALGVYLCFTRLLDIHLPEGVLPL